MAILCVPVTESAADQRPHTMRGVGGERPIIALIMLFLLVTDGRVSQTCGRTLSMGAIRAYIATLQPLDGIMTAMATHSAGFGSVSGRLVVDTAEEGAVSPFGRSLFTLTLSVWLGSFLLSTVRDLADPPTGFALMTVVRLAFAAFGAVLCVPLHMLLRRLERKPSAVQLSAGVFGSAIAAVAYTQLTFVAMRATSLPVPNYGAAWQFYNTIYWALFFIAWSALRVALSYGRQVTAHAQRASEAEALARDAQIRALRYQVDPHFLFNALNSVSALVVADRKNDAEEMLSKLAAFFRASIAVDPRDDVPLREEIGLQRLFLEIEQVRYPDLTITIDVESTLNSALVPALILQPLLENAVKFGVARREGAGHISIHARSQGNRVWIAVEDDGLGIDVDPGTGTGLRNVEDRLRARFGDQSRVEAGPIDGGGYRASVFMPLRRA
jgi:two-component system, LytTR family, sensor kinase